MSSTPFRKHIKNHFVVIVAVVTTSVFVVMGTVVDIDKTTASQIVTVQNYSAHGTVSAISTSPLGVSIADVAESPFDVSAVKKIENGHYVPLSIVDIKVGDEIIVQGIKRGAAVVIRRVIDLTDTGIVDVASTTASSTASTTPISLIENSASSTVAASSAATTTIDIATTTLSVSPDVSSAPYTASASSTSTTVSSPTVSSTTVEVAPVEVPIVAPMDTVSATTTE
ncbi:MAG: hypothetical protein WCQ60_01535 [bacterium]